MESASPIGLFDSGVGGISVMREVRRLLPAEDLVYYADSAHCPYGHKPQEEIQKRMFAICDFLMAQGVKTIVVACNTASIAGLDVVRKRYGVPMVGMEPAVKPATQASRNGRIGVLATGVTLAGERFTSLVDRFADGVQVYTQPCPGLVELVESGRTEGPDVEETLGRFLTPLTQQSVDTIVLGCTHYPFLRDTIQRMVGNGVALIDTGEAVARQVKRVLQNENLLRDDAAAGREVFYTSADPEALRPVITRLWGRDDIEVRFEAAEQG